MVEEDEEETDQDEERKNTHEGESNQVLHLGEQSWNIFIHPYVSSEPSFIQKSVK